MPPTRPFLRPACLRLACAAALATLFLGAATPHQAWALWTRDGVELVPGSVIQGVPPGLAPGPSGDAYLTWHTSSAISALRFQPDGSPSPGWPASGAVAVGPILSGNLIQHTPSADGVGGLVIFYREAHGSVAEKAGRIDGTGSVPSGWPVGVAFSSYLSGVSDGFGGGLAAWNVRMSFGSEPLVAKRLGPSGTAVWPSNYSAGNANLNWAPNAAPDGVGGGFFAWRCAVLHVDAAGTQAWSHALPTCGSAGPSPVLIRDDLGGVLVAWTDGTDVYALRFDSSGSIASGWNANGVRVGHVDADETLSSTLISIVSDHHAGAIIGWVSPFYGPERLQRVTSEGRVPSSWPSAGKELSLPIQVQETPALVADADSGAYVAWTDNRGGTSVPSDITAQHVLGNGSIASGWGPLGSPICTAPDEQRGVQAASDGAGGVYLAWLDRRRGGSNFGYFGQHVLATDNLSLAVEPSPRAASQGLSIELPRPHPVRGDVALSVSLPAAGRATLEVFDLAGRRAAEVALPDAGPGTRSVRLPTSSLGPGVYLVRLAQGERAAFARIVVAH